MKTQIKKGEAQRIKTDEGAEHTHLSRRITSRHEIALPAAKNSVQSLIPRHAYITKADVVSIPAERWRAQTLPPCLSPRPVYLPYSYYSAPCQPPFLLLLFSSLWCNATESPFFLFFLVSPFFFLFSFVSPFFFLHLSVTHNRSLSLSHSFLHITLNLSPPYTFPSSIFPLHFYPLESFSLPLLSPILAFFILVLPYIFSYLLFIFHSFIFLPYLQFYPSPSHRFPPPLISPSSSSSFSPNTPLAFPLSSSFSPLPSLLPSSSPSFSLLRRWRRGKK